MAARFILLKQAPFVKMCFRIQQSIKKHRYSFFEQHTIFIFVQRFLNINENVPKKESIGLLANVR